MAPIPSLPLALGGDGITLRDAAALYAALATDGTGGPLRLLADQPPPRPDFLPASAAHAVADVLTRPLPEFGPRGIAWKTGTSWGGRDAWAFGFDSRHVVAVWIGRPDGTPLPGATGASLALPLLSRVFDLLPKAPRPTCAAVRRQPRPSSSDSAPAGDALHLLFPPPGAVLSADGPVTIRVMGGRRPLTFLVDGAPLPADRIRREAAWLPSGPGFYRLTVLDADGTAVRASVQVARHAMTRAHLLVLLALLGLAACADRSGRAARRRTCPLIPLAEMPLEVRGNMLFVQAKINGAAGDPAGRYRRRTHTADRGRGGSAAPAAGPSARDAHLSASAARPRPGTPGCRTASCSAARTSRWTAVTVGRFGIKQIAGGSADGLLGADILLAFDVDLDLPAQPHHVLPRPPRVPRGCAAVERALRRRLGRRARGATGCWCRSSSTG